MTDLATAILDLRAAVVDEDAGNDRVRDCAFEVVEAYAQAIAANTTRCARCNLATVELVNGWLYGPMCLQCAEVAFSDIGNALKVAHAERAERLRESRRLARAELLAGEHRE